MFSAQADEAVGSDKRPRGRSFQQVLHHLLGSCLKKINVIYGGCWKMPIVELSHTVGAVWCRWFASVSSSDHSNQGLMWVSTNKHTSRSD